MTSMMTSASTLRESSSSTTYEQAMAESRESILPDLVQWDETSSFRGQPYRMLHHQGGVVGHLCVRLIEARNLGRTSCGKEYGPVSSYAVFHISCFANDRSDRNGRDDARNNTGAASEAVAMSVVSAESLVHTDRKMRASSSSSSSSLSSASIVPDHQRRGTAALETEYYRSSVVPHTNHPTWTSTREGESCFSMPIRKGLVTPDGSVVYVHIEMKEEDHRLFAGDKTIGCSRVNVRPLLFGEEGVLDIWLDLKRGDDSSDGYFGHVHEQPCAAAGVSAATSVATAASSKHAQKMEGVEGRVRLLVSYQPTGMKPRENDVVCLEAFARSPTSCVVHPPAQPMKVLSARGDYILVRYLMKTSSRDSGTSGRWLIDVPQWGQMRLHRNTVFVIERFSVVDGVVDLALKPADILGSMPVVQAIGRTLRPYTGAVGDLAMPAILSARLVMAAAKTTASAGLTGVATTGKVLLMAVAAGNRGDGNGIG